MSNALDFGAVKALAIAALKAAAITGVKAVEPFAGQIEDAIECRCAKFPLLAVAYTGTDPEKIDGPSWQETHHYSVGIFAHSLRGPVDLSDQADALVSAVKLCLVNARLADNLQPIEQGSTSLVSADAKTLIYEFAFSVQMDQEYQWPT